MFTGIVEELGIVKSIKLGSNSSVIKVQGEKVFDDLKIGDSVSTNGVCLTVNNIIENIFSADIMNETLSRSSFKELETGDYVNLERAMPSNGRFGGHMVSGHIDGVGKITSIKKDNNAIWYTIKTDKKIMQYIIEKGSIAIDGISLTVAKVERDCFMVSIIPHTLKETVLFEKRIGSMVNLENDMVGKYIEKFLNENKGITREFLLENGF